MANWSRVELVRLTRAEISEASSEVDARFAELVASSGLGDDAPLASHMRHADRSAADAYAADLCRFDDLRQRAVRHGLAKFGRYGFEWC